MQNGDATRVLVANLRPHAQEFVLRGLPAQVAVTSLDEESFARAVGEPERYRAQAGAGRRHDRWGPGVETAAVCGAARGFSQGITKHLPGRRQIPGSFERTETRMDAVYTSAPAKIILFGEHGVNRQQPALATAADLRTYCRVQPRGDAAYSLRGGGQRRGRRPCRTRRLP